MISDKATIIKAAELGILRTIPSFLGVPLKPGRLRLRFLDIELIVDQELTKIRSQNEFFFTDNRKELLIQLEKFGGILNAFSMDSKSTHVGSIIAFCLAFLEHSTTVYSDRLYKSLREILDYYERNGNVVFSELWTGDKFHEEWRKVDK